MIDFEKAVANAPDEVKQKMAAASHAFKRYQKAQKQVKLWQEEKDISGSLHLASQSDWNECLNRWDPETNILIKKEEADQKEELK